MKTFSRPGWVSCSKAVVLFLLLLSLATALACSGGLPKDIPMNEEAIKKAVKDKTVGNQQKWDTFVKERSGGDGSVPGLPEQAVVAFALG